MPINYQRSKIYRIYSDLDELEGCEYIGSTAKLTLAQRMTGHRADAKRGKTSRLYQLMRQYGIENFSIELVEQYPCNSKDELRQRENQVIRERRPVWNTNAAFQTVEEYKAQKANWKKTNRTMWNQLTKKSKNKTKAQKKFYCIECDLAAAAPSALAIHKLSKNHKLNFCDYHGIDIADYDPDLPVEYGNYELFQLGLELPDCESDFE